MLTKQIKKYQNTLKSIQNDIVIPMKSEKEKLEYGYTGSTPTYKII